MPIEKRNDLGILLVEDNDKLREQLAKNLNEYYSVIACSNVGDAVESLKKNKVQLVVSDIILGNNDGINLCKIIKTEMQLNIPIILITGVTSTEIQVEAYNSGADAFIKKPFELDVLMTRIQNLLASQNK